MRLRAAPLILALGAAASAVGVLVATSGSFFVADDYIEFAQARSFQFNLDYLGLPYFEDFAPGHRVLDKVLVTVLDTQWAGAQALLIGFWLVAVVAFADALRQLIRPHFGWALLVLFLASSPVWVRLLQWWASGALVAPGLAGAAVTLAGALRWHRTRSAWALVLMAVGYTLAVLAYAKPLLLSAEVALMLWFVLAPQLRPSAIGRSVLRDWPVLLVFVAVSLPVLYLVLDARVATPRGVSFDVWREYLVHSWDRGVWPLLAGRTVTPPVSASDGVVIWATQLFLVVLIALSVARRASAWRAWAFLVFAFLINESVVGYARLSVFGPGIGADLRYQAEFAYLIPLTLALAFRHAEPGGGPVRPLAPRLAARVDGLARALRVRPALTAGIVVPLVALFAVSLAGSYRTVSQRWIGAGAREFAERLDRSYRALEQAGVRPTILDAPVPTVIVLPAFDPFNRLSYVAPAMLHRDDVPVDSTDPGRKPVIVLPHGEARLPRYSVRGRRSLGGRCNTGPARVPVPVTFGPRLATHFAVIEAMRVRPDTTVRVFVDRGQGYPRRPERILDIVPGRGSIRLSLGVGRVEAVRLDVKRGGALCLSRVALYDLS